MADNPFSQIGVRVSDDERKLLEQEAEREHLSMAGLVRSIVFKELKRRELLRQIQPTTQPA